MYVFLKKRFSNFHIESSQTGQSHIAVGTESGMKVKNLVLDHYCKQKDLFIIDFAKIDLEGHELSALKGWENLRQHLVRAIYIEIIPENQKRYGLKANAPNLFRIIRL